MTKQNILIINFNSLYEILDEIKVNLSFNIVKHDNEDDFIKYNYTSPNNFLIITKSNKKILINKNLTKKNFLDLSNFPLSINKLIELINIQLIKLKFNLQAKIIINGYELNLNSKFLFKGNLSLKLTEKEIEIILYLNENRSKHDVLDLQKNIWYYSAGVETHTVETHIYRLRKKLSNKFNDAELILTDPNGYFIN